MREIAFKAKEIGTGDWVYGYLIKIHEDDYRIVTEDDLYYAYTGGYDYDGSMTKIDKNTICQFTGLTDKNGNKIWENDVLKSGLVVTYEKEFASFCLSKKEWAFRHFFGEAVDGCDCEVIGNLFDNTELLGGGAE